MIALLGGTFDPPHLGHLNMALQCAETLQLQSLYFLPCAIPVHKQRPSITDAHRINMLKLMLQNHDVLKIDERELLRQGPSYSLLTLQELRQEAGDSPIIFLMGMDSFNTFHLWYHWQEITKLCHLVVYQRPGQDNTPDSALTNYLKSAITSDVTKLTTTQAGHCFFLDGVQRDIASSDIRKAIAQQNTDRMEQWLTRPVIEYINQHRLYAE
ncbi:nicotinate-nucleotide adenylyltransferase [Pseudoalteromonas sp. T1lg65]|uniref:nicotinate-nucleotide adenylyltransferase n=1 Tax=Pseudoalteromonas sp. T1lg65 TaxID=2077101 RepID=UPI003F7A22A5